MTTQRDMSKSRAGVNTVRVQVALVCFTVCLHGGSAWFGGGTAGAQTVDPYEAIVYEQPNFAGKSASFKLDPTTMRQRLVPCHMPYKISSVLVGSKVAVELFLGPEFPSKVYRGSSGIRLLRSYEDLSAVWIDSYSPTCSSLILFPRDAGQPLGVWLALYYVASERVPGEAYKSLVAGKFFPLPESLSERTIKYGMLGGEGSVSFDNHSEFVAINGQNTYVTLYDLPGCAGKSITLPGAAAGPSLVPADLGQSGVVESLGKYGFENLASSLEVGLLTPGAWKAAGAKSVIPNLSGKWDSNMVGHSPVKEIKGEGESIEITQNGKQFTWKLKGTKSEGSIEGNEVTTSFGLKGTITQIDPGGMAGIATRIEWNNGMVFYRKTPPKVAGAHPAGQQSGVASISGTWDSSLGNVYEITQNGNQFNWFAASINQQAAGTVSGKAVSASWQAPGPGSAKGNITQIDPAGTATRIDWDNGVVFTRKGAPAAPPAPPAGGLPAPPGQQAPGPQGWVLEDMTDRPGMDIKVFSLNGSVDDCMKACQSDPNCKAFTYFGPEQGPQARCHLKSGVPSPVKAMSLSAVRPSQQGTAQQSPPQPAPPQPPTAQPVTPGTPDVSGKWNSSIGVVYEITQSGSQFSWYAATLKQNGSGTLAGKDMSASWSDAGGSGSAKGKIAGIDASGRATRIDWDNGVVFYR